MQKKAGIRLRHLQIAGKPQMQPHPQQPEPPRKQERSTSPLGRKKIFNRNSHQQMHSEQAYNPVLARHVSETGNNRQTATVVSPISGQPFNSHNNSLLNNDYEVEIERLIESLRKKSIELEKKQETIFKLNKEIELLRAQNSTYMQEVRTLRAQLQYERTAYKKQSAAYGPDNAKTHQQFNKRVFTDSFQNNQVPAYTNEPYQQFQTPLQNQKTSSRVEYAPSLKVRHTKIHDQEQDSITSDFLSPLMVLNSCAGQKHPVMANQGRPVEMDMEQNKSSSRIEYHSWKGFEEERMTKTATGNYYHIGTTVENPFAKHSAYAQPQGREQRNPYPDRKYNQERPQQQVRRAPTLESSGGHFNTNMGHEGYDRPRNEGNSRKLAIEDSRQFHFEDFDFSSLDNSNTSKF